MTDLENREILREALELLKTQILYIRNLHDAFSALHAAATQDDPLLKQRDHEEMLKMRPNDVQQSALDQINVLLQRLANSQ